WLPVRWLASDAYESQSYLRTYSGSVLILRAGRDQVIPAAATNRLIESLEGSTPVVVDFPRADHNDISLDPRYGNALQDFVR
ncbi:MAG: alpha/beta hydrolase, partial [Pseudoxanthomonas sp.]